jgi:thiol-disulfide isomerase/thioredoxin
MSEVQGGRAVRAAKLRTAASRLGLVVLLAALYGAAGCGVQSGKGDLKALAKGPMAKLAVADRPGSLSQLKLEGPDGRPVDLAALKGQVVVVNLWASWCGPCKIEMPTLAKLQAAYAGKPVQIVPVSLDKGEQDIAKAKALIAANPPLRFHHADLGLAFTLDPPVQDFPTTLLYGPDGVKRAQLVGPADWSTPEARAVIDRLAARAG